MSIGTVKRFFESTFEPSILPGGSPYTKLRQKRKLPEPNLGAIHLSSQVRKVDEAVYSHEFSHTSAQQNRNGMIGEDAKNICSHRIRFIKQLFIIASKEK